MYHRATAGLAPTGRGTSAAREHSSPAPAHLALLRQRGSLKPQASLVLYCQGRLRLHGVLRNCDSTMLHVNGLLEWWATDGWHNACGLVTLLVSGQGLPDAVYAVWGLQARREMNGKNHRCVNKQLHIVRLLTGFT